MREQRNEERFVGREGKTADGTGSRRRSARKKFNIGPGMFRTAGQERSEKVGKMKTFLRHGKESALQKKILGLKNMPIRSPNAKKEKGSEKAPFSGGFGRGRDSTVCKTLWNYREKVR